MPQKSDLPFGSEFSPSNVDLKTVLEFAKQHGGDWKKFEAAVHDRFFSPKSFPKTSEYNRRKRANNTKLGLQAYQIIDDDARLTPFGEELYEFRNNEPALYEALARHILLNLHGATLVQTILDIQSSGEKVDLVKLRQWMEDRGVHFPRGGKHPSMMRLWLEKAGVFLGKWRVDEERLKQLTGVGREEMEALSKLTPQQRAFLKALVNLGATGTYQSNEIEAVATATYGTRFNEKSLAKDVVYPLRDAGLIAAEKETRAKPFQIRGTDKLIGEVVEPLLKQLEAQVDTELRPFLRKPLADVLQEMDSQEKHVRGLALEALAIKLMKLIDLNYRGTRLRGKDTGGAEVDVVFESSRLVFSRWQVQCKNTARVSLDDVAKEWGLAYLLKSTVIVMLSTGGIGEDARGYANTIMTGTGMCVAMIDRADVQRIARDPSAIISVLNREAKHAMKLKTLTL